MAQFMEEFKTLTEEQVREKIRDAETEAEVMVWDRILYHITHGNIVQMSDSGTMNLIPIVPGTIDEDILQPNEMPANKIPV